MKLEIQEAYRISAIALNGWCVGKEVAFDYVGEGGTTHLVNGILTNIEFSSEAYGDEVKFVGLSIAVDREFTNDNEYVVLAETDVYMGVKPTQAVIDEIDSTGHAQTLTVCKNCGKKADHIGRTPIQFFSTSGTYLKTECVEEGEVVERQWDGNKTVVPRDPASMVKAHGATLYIPAGGVRDYPKIVTENSKIPLAG